MKARPAQRSQLARLRLLVLVAAVSPPFGVLAVVGVAARESSAVLALGVLVGMTLVAVGVRVPELVLAATVAVAVSAGKVGVAVSSPLGLGTAVAVCTGADGSVPLLVGKARGVAVLAPLGTSVRVGGTAVLVGGTKMGVLVGLPPPPPCVGVGGAGTGVSVAGIGVSVAGTGVGVREGMV